MIVFQHVFKEKYINYDTTNIIHKKQDRKNEIIKLNKDIQNKLNEIEPLIFRIKNLILKKKLIDLISLCDNYADYIMNIINIDEDLIFIRNYLNFISIINKINKICNLLIKLNTERKFKLIDKIKSKINKIDVILFSEQVKCNQYLYKN